MTPANLEKLNDEKTFDRLTIGPALYNELAELQRRVRDGNQFATQHLERNYIDPIRNADAEARQDYGMPWLAAFAPIGDTGLFAVVQEPRDAALAPVREIRDGLLKYGAGGLVLCVTLVVTSWYFARRVMRSEGWEGVRRSSAPEGVSPTGSFTGA
jgi:hypothetical protein